MGSVDLRLEGAAPVPPGTEPPEVTIRYMRGDCDDLLIRLQDENARLEAQVQSYREWRALFPEDSTFDAWAKLYAHERKRAAAAENMLARAATKLMADDNVSQEFLDEVSAVLAGKWTAE